MKSLFTEICFLVLTVTAFGQNPTFDWSIQNGGIGNDDGLNAFTDANENTYIVGRFQNTVDFDPGTGVNSKTAAGGTDIFVQKITATGTLEWVVTAGASGNDQAVGIYARDGYVYVTGRFHNTVDFDPGTGIHNLTGSSSGNGFVWKLDTTGSFVWAKNVGGSGNEGRELRTDSADNVIITGWFTGTADFNPSATVTNNLVSAGGNDMYLWKHFIRRVCCRKPL